MRKVHDVIYCLSVGNGRRVCLSFIQHGSKEDGFVYENICPWCAQTLEKVTVHPDADWTTVGNRLLQGLTRHYQFCVHRGTATLQVEKTDVPLGTEHVPKEI